MPESIIFSGASNTEQGVMKPTATFTGEVYLDLISMDSNASIANVTFTPCWLCDKGGEARRIKAGDVIWAQPGTTHWHGADDGSIMTHFVVGLGDTNWLEKVTDEDYKKRSEL